MGGTGATSQQGSFKLILFAGLLLSETQLLVNLKSYALVYTMPYFTLVYFILSIFTVTQPPATSVSSSPRTGFGGVGRREQFWSGTNM